jgi:predicted ATPase
VRVLYVSQAVVRDPAFVAAAIAESLGLADASARDLPARARGAVSGQRVLLVLDNFEHVIDAAPLVADLLTAVATLRIVVTSRAPLRVRGEREFAVEPLRVEAADHAAHEATPATMSPAVHLFVARVQDVRDEFHLTPATHAVVAAICRRLDALPLALELAAPWTKLLSPEDLLRRLERDVLAAGTGARDLPERQRTINATVAWSYQLLDPDEQRAFRRFGALPGLFPIDAAASVLADTPESPEDLDQAVAVAARLMDKSLLIRADNSVVATCSLYQMLETVRAYAALQLVESGERDAAMDGLVRYCRREASMAIGGLSGPGQVEWLDRVREDLESYRSALAWLLERRRVAEASEIAWALAFFWLIRGHSVEGLQWYERILETPPLAPIVEARALIGVGLMSYSQGELDLGLEALTRGVDLADACGDQDLIGHAEHLRGHVELASGHMETAHARFTRSISVFRQLATPWGIGSSVSGLAWVALASGHQADVEPLLEEASLALVTAGPWFMTLVRYLRSVIAVRRGDADGAIAMVRENLAHIRQLHDMFALVYALVPLTAAAMLKGDDEWAARVLGAHDAFSERSGVTFVDTAAQDLRERAVQDLPARLGAARWATAYAAGRRSSLEQLLDDIDRSR